MNILKNISFKLEPIVNMSTGQVKSFEVLTILKGINSEFFFKSCSEGFLLYLFNLQLDVLDKKSKYHVNFPSYFFIKDNVLSKIKKNCPSYVTLEVQDPQNIFLMTPIELKVFQENIRTLISSGIDVWIDDVDQPMIKRLSFLLPLFSGIKIDKYEVWRKTKSKNLASFIKETSSYNNNLILEGIENKKTLFIAKKTQATLGQGYVWTNHIIQL